MFKNLFAKAVFVASAGFITTSVVSSPAYASTSTIAAPSIPFALAYGACIYSETTLDPEADCTSVRELTLAEADVILRRFYPGENLFVRRSLRALFDDMDKQAIELRREKKPVGEEVISFMECTSKAMRSTPDFQRGVYVDGIGAFRECRDTYDHYLTLDRSSNKVQRNVNYLRYIKAILPMEGPEGSGIARDGLLIERGPRD